jgi:hypothetical protein
MGAVQTATEVVNLIDKVIPLVKSNEVETMPQFASALPPGVDPNVASHWTGWSTTPQVLQLTVDYPPGSSTLYSDTKFHLGVRFSYGGRADNQPWTFIKDLEAFVIVDSVTAFNQLDVAVKFASTGTPIDTQKTVMLTGSFNCRMSHSVFGTEFSQFFGVQVFGNGAAEIRGL